MQIEITEEQRQLIALALAELSLTRPGFHYALLEIAEKGLGAGRMFEELKRANADRIKPHEQFRTVIRIDPV